MLDLIIVGGGPAGYTAALRAGQLGLRTLLVERGEVGGRGLHAGVVPSKGLIEAARAFHRLRTAPPPGLVGLDAAGLSFDPAAARAHATEVAGSLARSIAARLEKWGVEFIRGQAIVVGDHAVSVNNRVIEARSIMIATGTETTALPYAAVRIVDGWAFSRLVEIPSDAIVYGSGRVAVEIAQYLALLGAPPRLVVPGERVLPDVDRVPADFIQRRLSELGVAVRVEAAVDTEKIEEMMGAATVVINAGAGRAVVPVGADSSPELERDGAFLATDDARRTSIRSIYAVGSVNGRTDSAQAAAAEGRAAVGHIVGVTETEALPLQVLYTDPEVAQVGATAEHLEAEGVSFSVATVPFDANVRAQIGGADEGFLRVLYEPTYGEVLGVQIVARHAADLIGEAAAMMRFEATVFDVAQTVHPHPTLSEMFIDLEEYARRS